MNVAESRIVTLFYLNFMKVILYRIWQCTWGVLQTLFGLIAYLMHYKNKHFSYHGAIVTVWDPKTSVSPDLFVFVTSEPYFAKKFDGQISVEELSNRLLVHEYRHTIQSLILGPLYLILLEYHQHYGDFCGERSVKRNKFLMGLLSRKTGK